MKTQDLTGNALAHYVAAAGLQLNIYSRDPELYTLPLINTEPNFVGNLFYAKPRTSINDMQPVPPKFYRPAFALFQPEINAEQGLYIIERLRIKVEPDGHCALATTPYRISMQGTTYLQAGLRAVVASVYGDEVPDEVPL